MDLLPAVRSHTTSTARLTMHWLEAGPPDGVPVVLVHGNLSTGRYFEHLLPGAPDRYRFLVPDMRGFGRSQALALDGTRGLRDWSDDVASLVSALGIDEPVHLLGWSTGGAAVAQYALDHGAAASLTLLDPVSPFGFGGVKRDGSLCWPDNAGAGAAGVSPEFVQRLRDGDRGSESRFSPRRVLNATYWAPSHREPPDREDLLVDEMLLSLIGPGGYPGDGATSPNWPGFAPGSTGVLNALAPKHCRWDGIVDLERKPPVLWTHGERDVIISDTSAWEIGTLGAAGHVPGWPGADVFPPQPMVTQIRDVLEDYRQRGGRVEMHMFAGSGHGPHFDATERWSQVFFDFLGRAASQVP